MNQHRENHRDPVAAPSFEPFAVVHRWKEGGQEKSFKKTIDRLPLTYDIPVAADPEMVSVCYEMPSQ